MQRIIRSQQILVNSQKAKPARRVYLNDRIEFFLPSSEVLAENMPLDIVYEDNEIVALNKQPGIIVHPARGNSSGTLLNGLVHYADKSFTPDVVHRLDRDTSGLIVFSKNSNTNTVLSEQFQSRTAKKRYLAIVEGEPKPNKGRIELPIGEIPSSQRYGVIEDGKYALTLYKTIASYHGYSVVKIDLKTGRTHQIRVHFSQIGNPLIADNLYGGKVLPKLTRCALHSWQLNFNHPTTGENLTLQAPIPEDMSSYIEDVIVSSD